MKKTILIQFLVLVTTILTFDITAYLLLPDERAKSFPGYRCDPPKKVIGGRSLYPKDYFKKHPERGFDIIPNAAPKKHYVPTRCSFYEYEIWGNSLGCFDKEHPSLGEYIYLAGDSQTWGYTAYVDMFGSILEDRLPLEVLKCGVTNTGQQHQLSKAKEVINEVGHAPKIIVVSWLTNDIVNDHAHPHGSVFDGWQVNTVKYDSDYNLVQIERDVIEKGVKEKLEEISAINKSKIALKPNKILQYSVTAQILNKLLHALKLKGASHQASPIPSSNVSSATKRIYEVDQKLCCYGDGRINYKNNKFAENNKQALIEFRDYSESIGSEFLVVIHDTFPSPSELTEFLEASQIDFLNLGDYPEYVSPKNKWEFDSHLNPLGNLRVADILEQKLGPDLDRAKGSKKLDS